MVMGNYFPENFQFGKNVPNPVAMHSLSSPNRCYSILFRFRLWPDGATLDSRPSTTAHSGIEHWSIEAEFEWRCVICFLCITSSSSHMSHPDFEDALPIGGEQQQSPPPFDGVLLSCCWNRCMQTESDQWTHHNSGNVFCINEFVLFIYDQSTSTERNRWIMCVNQMLRIVCGFILSLHACWFDAFLVFVATSQ